jgi:hypothetical protein
MKMSDNIPKEFRQIIRDFLNDLLITFPEYRDKMDTLLLAVLESETAPIEHIFDHVTKVFPEQFFDILYKNSDIFTDSSKNCEFLPGINFADIWKTEDVSDNTRDTIWKYLQLIMFSVLETVKSQESFGDAAKMFEAINEDELKSKIQETVEQMKDLFGDQESNTTFNVDDLPDADSVHEHLNGIMDGNLGKLASEIAQETAQEFNFGIDEDVTDVGEVFQKLFQNPGKLMGLVNNISNKLDTKLKSGDINENDLMKEAGDLMGKMKNMPGMPNFEDLLKNMNVSKQKQGMVKQQLNNSSRMNSTKARLQRKLEQRKALEAAKVEVQKNKNVNFDGKTFSDGSVVERSKAKK